MCVYVRVCISLPLLLVTLLPPICAKVKEIIPHILAHTHLYTYIHPHAHPPTEAELNEMIQRADADQDGEVSFEDFYTIMTRKTFG